MGVIGIAAFYIIYTCAITMIGIGMASELLYNAPLWVMLFGFFFQKEPFEG
jgi:drug/metabolite transporter (DMT)-like permease